VEGILARLLGAVGEDWLCNHAGPVSQAKMAISLGIPTTVHDHAVSCSRMSGVNN
jgi:hypothetical protein